MNSPNVSLDDKTVDTAPWAKRFRQASEISALLVASLGLVVLGGWVFNVPALTSIRPTFVSMKVNAALSFLTLGGGLWLAQDDKWPRSRRILGIAVIVLAGLTLAEYAFRINLGIDQLLLRDTRIPSLSAYPGRMAIGTATCFLLLGLAVALMGTTKAIALRHSLVAPCFAFSVVALCGYLYGTKSLYAVTAFSTVGLHTAAGLFTACLAYFLARPGEGMVSIAASDTNSGLLLRTLLPAILVVPILIGWLRLEGQRANLYDTQFGVALLVLVSIGCLTALAVLVARSMHRLELERSRGEAARIRSAAIVESSDDAIIGTDVNGKISGWNQGAERLFGYLANEAIGRSISFLAPAGQLDQAQHIFKNVISGEVVKRYETVRQRKDGTVIDISLTASPILDAGGRVVGASGIARDITEHKQYEEALRASEGRLRLAQQAAHIGTFEQDLRTGRLTWVAGLESLYGMPPGSLDGKTIVLATFKDLIHPADWERFQHLTRESLTTGHPTRGEWRAIWPDGSLHWIAARWQVLMDESGEPARVIGVNIDVTERKLAEEAVRRSEEKFRNVFREAGVGMVIVSPEGRFLAANHTFCDCLGYTETELLEKTVESITFPEDWPPFSIRLGEALREGRGFQWAQKRCLHKSGQIVYTETSASLIRTRDGSPEYFVAEVLDVTSRKEAEKALSAMTRKLIEAQEQERARIARELHDDVTQQLALLAMELDQWDQSTSHDADFREHIRHAKRRISEIGEDVQELSHQLHSSKLEYLGLAAAAKGLSKEISRNNRVRVDFTEVGVPRTLPNEVSLALFRILQEALHNAVEHSEAKDVDVRLWEESNELHLTVKDLGKGFDPLSAMQGAGLGLTSMRERARLVNGNIAIESKPMQGTTIHVRVPLNSGRPWQKVV